MFYELGLSRLAKEVISLKLQIKGLEKLNTKMKEVIKLQETVIDLLEKNLAASKQRYEQLEDTHIVRSCVEKKSPEKAMFIHKDRITKQGWYRLYGNIIQFEHTFMTVEFDHDGCLIFVLNEKGRWIDPDSGSEYELRMDRFLNKPFIEVKNEEE